MDNLHHRADNGAREPALAAERAAFAREIDQLASRAPLADEDVENKASMMFRGATPPVGRAEPTGWPSRWTAGRPRTIERLFERHGVGWDEFESYAALFVKTRSLFRPALMPSWRSAVDHPVDLERQIRKSPCVDCDETAAALRTRLEEAARLVPSKARAGEEPRARNKDGRCDRCGRWWPVRERRRDPELRVYGWRTEPPFERVNPATGERTLSEVTNSQLARHLSWNVERGFCVVSKWKPVLWFTKGRNRADLVFDLIRAPKDDGNKAHHPWGQAVGGFEAIIERFTRPGDLVLDPFVGGGATALAAVRLGRLFVGIDIDRACVRTTATRLGQLPK